MSWKNNWNKFVRNGIVTERKKTMNERWNDFVTGQDKQNKSKQIRTGQNKSKLIWTNLHKSEQIRTNPYKSAQIETKRNKSDKS